MKRAILLLSIVTCLWSRQSFAAPAKTAMTHKPLPVLGTELGALPKGKGRDVVESSCLRCHSTDILRQQRLTPKQWTAAVEKMMRWGVEATDAQKAAMIAYLSTNFGPENTSFKPVHTRPVGK